MPPKGGFLFNRGTNTQREPGIVDTGLPSGVCTRRMNFNQGETTMDYIITFVWAAWLVTIFVHYCKSDNIWGDWQ